MEPLLFHPLLKRTRWGGRRLGTLLGKPLGNETDYAESWEISDYRDQQSVVLHGQYRGWTLHQLVSAYARELLGRHHDWTRFPVLVKFLDAHDRLSVQVHPDDRQARAMGFEDGGKTEAWVVLHADPGSIIYAGLKPGIDRTALESHLRSGTLEAALHALHPRRGDCVFIPAGTVHALGEGIVVAEVEQSSDLTLRLHDWNRVGRDGRPRPLHLERALACIDWNRGPVEPQHPALIHQSENERIEDLIRCPHFVLQRRVLTGSTTIPADDRFRILITLEGNTVLGWHSRGSHENNLQLVPGQTVLLPATLGDVHLAADTQTVLLDVVLPE